jgi:hypothetical protein
VLPDTADTMPSTLPMPSLGGGAGVLAEVVGRADDTGFPVFSLLGLFDVPHAAADNAVTAVTTRIADRLRCGVGEMADINVGDPPGPSASSAG